MGQVGLEWSVAGFGDFSGNANETDMLMRNSNTGQFELYDISDNTIISAAPMGQVGLEWQVAGFGPIDGTGASDMLMRNTNTGAFEIYDIASNQLTSAAPMGQVELEWSVAGIASDPPAGAHQQPTRAGHGVNIRPRRWRTRHGRARWFGSCAVKFGHTVRRANTARQFDLMAAIALRCAYRRCPKAILLACGKLRRRVPTFRDGEEPIWKK